MNDEDVLALSGEELFYSMYPDGCWNCTDCNQDGTVDYDDIDPFVLLIGS